MSLVQVATKKITTGNEVQLVKFEQVITTDDVYMLVVNNAYVGADGGILDMQPMVDDATDTDGDINIAAKLLRTNATYQNLSNQNQSIWRATDGMTDSPDTCNFIMYLYNWNSSSEFSYVSMEVTSTRGDGHLLGKQHGGVKKKNTAYNGIHISTNQSSGGGFQNNGRFTLYRIVS